MKSDKTEREFREAMLAGGWTEGVMSAVIHAAALEFREEEHTKLPERVEVLAEVCLVAETGGDGESGPHVYREAARRYNAYPHLHALAVRVAKELEQRDLGGVNYLTAPARAVLEAAIDSGLLTFDGFEDPGAA
jgi:hypothetical protein